MKILFLSRWFPWPANNGARMRISNILRCLSETHTVDLVSFVVPQALTDLEQARSFCRQVKMVPYQPFQPQRWKALLGFISPWPRSVLDTYSTQMEQAIGEILREQTYDLVIASEIDLAPYVLKIPRERAKVRILEEIELTTLYEQQFQARNSLQQARHTLMWHKTIHYIHYLLKDFDGFTAVSEPELERVAGVLNAKADQILREVIPNGINLADYQGDFGQPAPETMIYTGALSYGANFDAVDYFLREIWPLLQKEKPQAQLFITGKTDPATRERLPEVENVHFTGYLPDIRPAIAQSWLNIVPLRIGGGTRLKILESLALKTPVISTSKGAEGLGLRPGQDILIADDPESFARQILRLWADPALRQRLSEQGRQAVSRYDWGEISKTLNTFIEKARTVQQSV